MSPSRFELREAVLRNPNGPELVGLVGAAVVVTASAGCSTSSPELAGVATGEGGGARPPAAGPTGVSTNSPDRGLAGLASSAQAIAGCAATPAIRTDVNPHTRANRRAPSSSYIPSSLTGGFKARCRCVGHSEENIGSQASCDNLECF